MWLCACGVLVDRFAAGGPRRTEGGAIGRIGIDYHGNVDCHDRRSAAGSRDRTLRGMADDLLLHCCGRGGRLAVSGGDLSPGPEPRHHFAAQGAFCWETPLVGVYVLTVLMVTGHYTGYSYIEPFLAQVAGLDNDWITWVLTAFGLVGIVGSLWFRAIMKNVPTPSCGLPSWVLRFSCCCCAFRLSGTFRLSPCVSAGGWPLRFSTWFSVGDHSSGSRGDGDRHVRLFGDLQRRNRCRGTRRRIRLYARFDCPDRLCRGTIALFAALFCLVRLVPLLKRSRG